MLNFTPTQAEQAAISEVMPSAFAEAIAKAANPFHVAIERYARAPIGFVREVLSAEPQAWQLEALRALARGHTRVAIRSCHGPGKTCLAAWVICWFMNTRHPFKVAITAPTAPQLFDALWPELLAWFNRLPPSWRGLWDITADHITMKGDQECFATARTSRPEKPEAMAGLHSTYILLVADEASGIDEAVFEAAMGSMSSAGATTLLIGNPTRNTGFFWRVHQLERDRWFTMKVGHADSPRVAQSYVDEMARRYGTNSNAFRIRCLGEFPTADDDAMIPADLVDSAMRRDAPLDTSAPCFWGVDCARFGNDASVLVKRQGYLVTEMPRRWYGWDTMQVAGAIKHEFEAAVGTRPALIVVDSIGVGAGVADRLHEQGLPVLGLNVAEVPAKEHYVRLRDQMWGELKDWLATRRVKLPMDERLRDDLCAPKFSFTSTGKLLVESKASMRLRGLPSCDSADALMLTLAQQAGLAVTDTGDSGLFSNIPVMGTIPGMEI